MVVPGVSSLKRPRDLLILPSPVNQTKWFSSSSHAIDRAELLNLRNVPMPEKIALNFAILYWEIQLLKLISLFVVVNHQHQLLSR